MIKRIGNDNVFAVVSTVGATVHEFVWYGSHIIAPHRIVGDKARGGIPICFPFFGAPPEKMGMIPKHGWLRHQELELINEADASVTFGGKNEPTEAYPWQLKYSITVTVCPDSGLELQLQVERLYNMHFSSAPINPGFHPYFCSDPGNLICGCMARVGHEVITDFPVQSYKKLVEESIFVRSGHEHVRMVLSGNYDPFSVLTFWSDNDKEYFCVEPVLTNPEVFYTGSGKYLKIGEKLEMKMQLNLL